MTSARARTVAVSGASGLLGTALCKALEAQGREVLRMVRTRQSSPKLGAGQLAWSPEDGTVDLALLEGVDAVVNLAGESVFGRWTEGKKARISKSRVDGTSAIANAIGKLASKPRVLVNASAVGYYPDAGDAAVDESHGPGTEFLSEVCVAWEAATAPARDAGVRVACSRTGIVLSREGGALAKMLLPFKLGVGGRMGDGEQYMSWIAIDDAVSALLFAIDNDTVRGPFNNVAPEPVTNREYTKALARVLGRPAALPVPAFALKAALGEFSTELLGSHRILPRALQRAGFTFQYPSLESALRAALGGPLHEPATA